MLEFITTVRSLATGFPTFWVFGYLASKFGEDDHCIRVPGFLFYLCGAPEAKKLPQGALTRLGVFFQIFVFLFLLAGIGCNLLFANKDLGGLIGLWISILGSVIIVLILQRY